MFPDIQHPCLLLPSLSLTILQGKSAHTDSVAPSSLQNIHCDVNNFRSCSKHKTHINHFPTSHLETQLGNIKLFWKNFFLQFPIYNDAVKYQIKFLSCCSVCPLLYYFT